MKNIQNISCYSINKDDQLKYFGYYKNIRLFQLNKLTCLDVKLPSIYPDYEIPVINEDNNNRNQKKFHKSCDVNISPPVLFENEHEELFHFSRSN